MRSFPVDYVTWYRSNNILPRELIYPKALSSEFMKRDLVFSFSCNSFPLLKVHGWVLSKFYSHNLRQSQTPSQRRRTYFIQYPILVLAFQKVKINVYLFKSSYFSYFIRLFLPLGLLRIIQNPNNPNRHKCQHWLKL